MKTTIDILKDAKLAEARIRGIGADTFNKALGYMAEELRLASEEICRANALDCEAAEGNISPVMIDRLRLTPERVEDMAKGILDVMELPTPIGEVLSRVERPNGLVIEKTSVPMGVVAIIYESRPNVTSDAAALAIKSGNVCILRGGKEAYRSARAIVDALTRGAVRAGLPECTVQLIDDTTRESANELMKARGYVDLLIPRGGKGLINACVMNATVPVIETGTGICHIFVDKSADLCCALDIIENAKTQRPSVCNAMEVLLVHEDIAGEFLPMLKERLVDTRAKAGLTPVEIFADAKALAIIDASRATDESFDTEFLDYKMALGIVGGVDEAIAHISEHTTHHSEAIITEDPVSMEKFTREVDSAAVYVNASTRFTDGGQFGLGCEMGISTQKMHARGPMGIAELTTYKYVIKGTGQIR
ncbi:MAG: glutamate-5-semialdehyde dehydrogenase [Clostridia bacterium]|nr:glutamate-5-semialdehyde dehydrogenase [Clostridia bacterium]